MRLKRSHWLQFRNGHGCRMRFSHYTVRKHYHKDFVGWLVCSKVFRERIGK